MGCGRSGKPSWRRTKLSLGCRCEALGRILQDKTSLSPLDARFWGKLLGVSAGRRFLGAPTRLTRLEPHPRLWGTRDLELMWEYV